jgi:hypothetical protein
MASDLFAAMFSALGNECDLLLRHVGVANVRYIPLLLYVVK